MVLVPYRLGERAGQHRMRMLDFTDPFVFQALERAVLAQTF
jgi:hypothetical protein